MTERDDFDEVREHIIETAESVGLRVMSAEELQAFMDEGAQARDAADAQALAEGRIFLDEETNRAEIDGWYVTARKVDSPDTLSVFVEHLIESYRHDYGTICHAIAAAALAGAYAVERSPQGGITGFQSGAVMWQFIQEWTQERGPKRLVKYEDLLYPQYVERVTEISTETWAWMQSEARKKLEDTTTHTHPAVWAHWASIADGIVPAPFHLEVVSLKDDRVQDTPS